MLFFKYAWLCLCLCLFDTEKFPSSVCPQLSSLEGKKTIVNRKKKRNRGSRGIFYLHTAATKGNADQANVKDRFIDVNILNTPYFYRRSYFCCVISLH